jgi:DNA-binding Lrp family transcriptional regulator
VQDQNAELIAAVNEIRDLIRLMAEPAIAERDRKLREELRRIVGKSTPKASAILLMDGTRTQTDIHSACGIHKGALSELVKQLKQSKLLTGDISKPKLAITILASFFESGGRDE